MGGATQAMNRSSSHIIIHGGRAICMPCPLSCTRFPFALICQRRHAPAAHLLLQHNTRIWANWGHVRIELQLCLPPAGTNCLMHWSLSSHHDAYQLHYNANVIEIN